MAFSSTLLDYRNSVRRYLLPHFGEDTPLVRITTEDIETSATACWSQ